MAGDIFQKERAIVSIATSGATGTSGSAISAGTFDGRAAGNVADDFTAIMQLTAQFATVTGIAAGTVIAELYLVPSIDGSTPADIDTTSGASYIPYTMRAGTFVASKAMVASTNQVFVTSPFDFMPVLYTVYILIRAGQSVSSGWTLKTVSTRNQYT